MCVSIREDNHAAQQSRVHQPSLWDGSDGSGEAEAATDHLSILQSPMETLRADGSPLFVDTQLHTTSCLTSQSLRPHFS